MQSVVREAPARRGAWSRSRFRRPPLPGAARIRRATAYGTFVQIQVSDTYPVDQTLPQGWATYPRDARARSGARATDARPDAARLRPVGLRAAERSPVTTRCARRSSRRPKTSWTRRRRRRSSRTSTGTTSRTTATTRRGPHSTTARSAGRRTRTSAPRRPAERHRPATRVSTTSRTPGEAFAESYRVLNLQKAGRCRTAAGTSSTRASIPTRPH